MTPPDKLGACEGPAAADDPARADDPAGSIRWVALVLGDDRPGTLAGVTSVFSTRGVSFESLATGTVDGDVGTIAVTFRATPRRQQVLTRTVQRLSVVRTVEVRPADDPLVRAAGLIHMSRRAAFAPPPATPVRCIGDAAAGQPVLVEGTLAQVTAVLAHAQQLGAAMTAVVVLGF